MWNNVIYTDPNVGKRDLQILPGLQHTDVWNNVIYEDPNVGKGGLRILPGVQHTDVWNNIIYEDPNVGKGGVFGSYRVYNTLTCETTSFTQIRTSGRGPSDPTGCAKQRQ